MTIRDIRQAPFCWQAKSALHRLRCHYSGERLKQRATAIAIYTALTEIASNQHSQDRVEAFVAQIVNLTGTSEATVKRYLRDFEERIGLIAVERRKIANTVSLANVYNLLTVPDDPPGFTGEPTGSSAVSRTGFTGEPRDATSEPSGDAREPLSEQRYLHDRKQRYQQIDEQQQQDTPNDTRDSIGKPDVVVNSADLIQLLTERGITATVAQRLVAQHSPTTVSRQVEYFDWEYDEEPDNPKMVPGRLRRRIEEDWAPPPGFVPATERERRAVEEDARRSVAASDHQLAAAERRALLDAIGVSDAEQVRWQRLAGATPRLPHPFAEALFYAPRDGLPAALIFRDRAALERAEGPAYHAERAQVARRVAAEWGLPVTTVRYLLYDDVTRLLREELRAGATAG